MSIICVMKSTSVQHSKVPTSGHAAVKQGNGAPAATQLTAPQRRFMLFALFLCNALASIDQSLMNVALHDVSTHFNVDLSVANWMVLGFSIVAGVVIMSSASILARIGLRKVIFIGLGCSLVGSLIGFVSWNFAGMLMARILQAITSGLLFPVISVAILLIAPPDKRATLLSLNSAIIGLGLAFSPSVSGLMITYFGINSVFLITLVLAVAAFAVSFFAIHNVQNHSRRKIDLLSILLSFVGLASFFYGLNELMKSPLLALILVAVGVVFIGLFAWRQNRLATPLLSLKAIKNLSFDLGEILAMMCYMGSIFMSLLIPLYLKGVGNVTTFEAGLLLATPICMYVISTYIGGRIEDRHGIWPLLPIGVLMVCIGFSGMMFISMVHAIIGLLVFSGVAYFGVGLAFAPTKSRDLEAVSKENVPSASSIHSTLVQIMNCISSAIFVGVMSNNIAASIASHASKATAYAEGFSHTAVIELVVVIVAFIVSIFFARAMHKKFVKKDQRQ